MMLNRVPLAFGPTSSNVVIAVRRYCNVQYEYTFKDLATPK